MSWQQKKELPIQVDGGFLPEFRQLSIRIYHWSNEHPSRPAEPFKAALVLREHIVLEAIGESVELAVRALGVKRIMPLLIAIEQLVEVVGGLKIIKTA